MLSVKFKFDPVLQKELKSIQKVETSTRALIVTMESELMRLQGQPLEATASMAEDFCRLRGVIATSKVDAAYIIIRLDEGKFAQVTFCSDVLRPKEKMLYASGADGLADALGSASLVKEHVVSVDDITPSLFLEKTPENRMELMTESEKLRAAMDAMEVVPMPVIMPGVAMPLSESGSEALVRLRNGEISAAVFVVETEKITVEHTIDLIGEASPLFLSFVKGVCAILPNDHPRFIVLCCPSHDGATEVEEDQEEEKIIMVYICPVACKPREKMVYASSKSFFLSQAKEHGINFSHRLELGDVNELHDAILDALANDKDAKT